MAIVKVQSVTGAGPTLVLNSVVAGNCLTYQSSYFRGVSTGLAEAVPTDTNGTFTVGRSDVPQLLSSEDQGASGFFQKNCAAGTHTVTPEANQAFNGTLTEWSGVDTVSPLIVGNSGKSSGTGTSQATGASASASSGDLSLIQHGMAAVVTGNANVGYTDPVANYTTLLKVTDDANNVATLHCFRVLSASGTETATFNWTYSQLEQFWQASIFVLKAASSNSGPAPGVFHGDGPGMGPRMRRMFPQKFPDTIPFVQDGSAKSTPFSLLSKTGFPRRRALAQRYPDAVVGVIIVNELKGTYSWLGTTSPLSKEIVSLVGAWNWVGKTSPLSVEIVTTTGKWTWAGKQSPLSVEIVSIAGGYTWAGKTASLSKLIAETVGNYSWSGSASKLSTIVAEIFARYTWSGTASIVTVPGAGGSVVLFYDGLSVADGLTYHQGLSRPNIILVPVGDGTYTVLKLSGVSDEDPALLSKETYIIDGILP